MSVAREQVVDAPVAEAPPLVREFVSFAALT
jgi:hypothetical protein